MVPFYSRMVGSHAILPESRKYCHDINIVTVQVLISTAVTWGLGYAVAF